MNTLCSVSGVTASTLSVVALVVALIALMRTGVSVPVAKTSRTGLVLSLAVLATIVYGMCRLSEWIGMYRFAVAGAVASGLAVLLLASVVTASIRSGRRGVLVSQMIDAAFADDDQADEVPQLVEAEESELVDEEEPEEPDAVLAPVVAIGRAA